MLFSSIRLRLKKIALTDDVAYFVAELVKSNVRELEGTLLRLAVKAELLGKASIDIDVAKASLRSIISCENRSFDVEDVQRIVSNYFGLKIHDLRSKRRNRGISYPRQIAMYLCRQYLGTSYPELGDRFGGKDHSTAISAVKKVITLIDQRDEKTLSTLQSMKEYMNVG